jgi:hypothetical protein
MTSQTNTPTSFIEANLLIMCCCLPTLRRFFKHFAPRLIGESSSGNSKLRPNGGFSNPNAPRTFGSNGTKRTLDTFRYASNENSGIPLSSFDELDKNGKGPAAHVKNMGRDSDSEEAILFERSVNVTYEEAGLGDRPGVQGHQHQPKVWAGNAI